MARPKKEATSTELAPLQAAGMPAEFLAAMQARIDRAKATQARLPTGGGAKSLSFRGGTMALGGEVIGNRMEAVILSSQFERGYWTSAYDGDSRSPPSCYSFDGDSPHPEAHDKQATSCEDCPHAKFGSADNGKGKACKEVVRLALLAPDALKSDLASADVFSARVSTMNVKTFDDYVTVLTNKKMAPEAVVTEVTCLPDPKKMYSLGFKALRGVETKDGSGYVALLARADKMISTPYPAPREEDKAKPTLRRSRMGR